MMNDTIYMTLKVYKNGSSNIVYLADYLGADVGEIVNITFYKMGDADKKLSKLRKRVVKVGKGRGIYIDKRAGVEKGNIIVARIDPLVAAGEKDDTRVKAEEGFKEPFE